MLACHMNAIAEAEDVFSKNSKCLVCTWPADVIKRLKHDKASIKRHLRRTRLDGRKDTNRGGSGEYKKLL